MANKILVVVDMQNDFLTGSLGNKECAETVGPVAELIKSKDWDKVIFTRDTHYSDYLDTLEGKKLPVKHCIKYTEGWEIEKTLMNLVPPEKVYIEDKLTFGCLELPQGIYYADNAADEIHICGVCTSICVLSNAAILRAYFPNTPIILHKDCTADVTPEMKEAALKCFQAIQCEVV